MKKKRSYLNIVVLVVIATILGACSSWESSNLPESSSEKPASADISQTASPQEEAITAIAPDINSIDTEDSNDGTVGSTVYAQTNLRPDGNRIVAGSGNIPVLTPQDIPLEGTPTWVTAVPLLDGLLWAVVMEDGRTQAFLVQNGQAEPYPITPSQLPAGMPPMLRLKDEVANIVLPTENFSPQTHPVFINDGEDLAYLDNSGNLKIQKAGEVTMLPINAQLDARILVDENGRLLLQTDPTDEYGHGIMGDKLEGRSLTLVATDPQVEIIRKIPAPPGYVLEGIAPIWVDFNGDDEREIIVTRSNANVGAQIVIMDEMGNTLASGPAIGSGGRWRHQLSVGPFGPNKEMELVDVLTPHIGGPTEFFQWQDDALVVVAEVNGYTSHIIGSRNLDMNVAGLFDDSGTLTVLLPSQARTELGAIQRSASGAQISRTLPLNGRLVANIFATSLANGRLAVGVGLDNNVLRVWQP